MPHGPATLGGPAGSLEAFTGKPLISLEKV
jgi:hypothetical protein